MAEALVVELLGGLKAIGGKSDPDFDREIRRGFRPQVFHSFKKNTQLSNSALARILGVSARSIDRFAELDKTGRIKPVVSDRLYRMARIVAFAENVLEDREEALRWLDANQPGLGGRRPMELIGTEAGTREVEEELLRIEHGFVA